MSQATRGSIAEVARIMGVSTETVRRRVADGTLEAVRFGPRLIRIDMESVERALRPMTTAGDAA